MKILVGYKGTNVGKNLMDIAAKHATAFGGELLVVTSRIDGNAKDQGKIDVAQNNNDNKIRVR